MHSQRGAAAARIGLAVVFAYAVILGGSWVGIYNVGVRIVTLAIVAGVLALWVIVFLRDPAWRPNTTLAATFIAATLSWVISVVFSRFQRMSLEYAAWAILLGALYLLLVQVLRRPPARRTLGFTALAVSAIIIAADLGRVLQLWFEWWGLLGRFGPPPLRPAFESLTYGNPSAVLTVALLSWLGGAAMLVPTSRRGTSAIVIVGLGIAVVALISGSRTGWLAIALAALYGVVLLANGRSAPWMRSRRRIVVSATALIGLAAAAAVVFLPGVVARIIAGGQDMRAAYAASAIRMFEESPIVGTGPGTWTVQRAMFTLASEPDTYVPHAHDAYVQVLAEFGLIGALAGLLVGLVVARLIATALRGDDAVARGIGIVAIVGSVYFAISNLFDFYFNMPAAMLGWIMPIALLDARRLDADSAPPPPGLALPQWSPASGRLARYSLIGAVVLGCGGLALSERVARTGDDAALAASVDDWGAAYRLAAEAVAADPEIPAYQVMLGLAADALGRPDRAAMAFRLAAERDDLPETWLDLAATEADLGNQAAARSALVAALRLGRQQAPVALGVAVVYRRLGDAAAANDALVASLIASPALAADPAWRAVAADTLGTERAVSGALAVTTGSLSWEIAAAAGRLDAAAARAAALAGPNRDVAELVMAYVGGDRNASISLIDYAQRKPFDRFALDWAGRVARWAGSAEAADRLRRLGQVATSDSTIGYAVAVTWVTRGEPSAGDRTTFYGPFTYRRLVPLNKFVRSLPGIEFR